MKTYRTGFLLAVIGNVVLASVLAGVWWHSQTSRPTTSSALEAMPTSNTPDSTQSSIARAAAMPEMPVPPLQISRERLQSIGVKTGAVERKAVEDEIRTTGNVVVDESRVAYVQLRYSGYIQKVFVDATYQYVRKGQPLFTIYSPDILTTEREYLAAKQGREQVAQSTVPEVASSAAALLDAAAGRLKQWGVPQTEIARLESTGLVQPEIEVDSPVSGYVTERNALQNVSVQPEMRLYTIADLSTVWVQAQAFQGDLGRIRIGAQALLAVDTFAGRTFHGRVDFIYPQLDADTRTAKVRLVFPNPGVQLKPGMFVNVTLEVPMGRQLIIPATGVLQSGTRQIAFVYRTDGYMEPREVRLGARVGDDFIVLDGVKLGEQVVTSANFLIDSESQLQVALGLLTPPSTSSDRTSAAHNPEASIELTSEPSPARKGSNVFRVKLVDASGSSISGAEVSVTFFLPAMPQMGMAALRTFVTLRDKSNGVYEGSGELASGGTWQVTVVARKQGQNIASRQLSIKTAGGM
jgi:Cu(I)/Ag(I) efflux system membrane fusion protein/cobalt-zinc-cadmium efflux system membrane fusion protein